MTANAKVGLLGAGYILDSHAKALQQISEVSLHAVCDVARGRAANAAARYGIPHVYDSVEKLAQSDCDVVHVLLPPAMHLRAASTLVDGGKSVFLEKPMGLNSTECRALSERAVAKGLAVGVNHNFLFSPGYEALRNSVKAGELGRIDHLSVNWHFMLPFLTFGPFDNWMLAAPSNTLFETGSHLSSIIVDLLGVPVVRAAVADNPIDLPAGQKVFRHWTAVGRVDAATVSFSISMTAGQADRILRIRGRGGSAQFDFGRDSGWSEFTVSDNPIFDSYETADSTGRQLRRQAKVNRSRRLKAALAKRPDANPFEESIFRSIKAFHSRTGLAVDPRQSGLFGADVIGVCESIVAAAGTGPPSQNSASVTVTKSRENATVLVVGGTGFIGSRLVRKLVHLGHRVRVLTRNPRAAAIELDGAPVEFLGGAHGDVECAKKALDGIETVYHLAKCEGKRWQDYVDGDIEPTRVLAEAALNAGVKRFIYTGTIASYATANPRDVIDNHTPIDPDIEHRSHYPRSKAACEALLQKLRRERGLGLVIFRPGVVIGPGSPPAHLGVGRFSSESRVDYWGDGMSSLPLVLVDDVADALARAIDAKDIEGQTFLLTSPPLMNARDYVAAVASHMGTRIHARPRSVWRNWAADMVKELAKNMVRHPNRRWPSLHDWRCQSHRAQFDSSMTEQVLGWRPVADRDAMVARGIKDAVDWYLR